MMIMLVLNFTESPIPRRIDCLFPSSFFPMIQLPRSFEPLEISTMRSRRKGVARR